MQRVEKEEREPTLTALGRRGRRSTGDGSARQCYEWDHTRSNVDVYDARGRHMGVADADAGLMIGNPVPGRHIRTEE